MLKYFKRKKTTPFTDLITHVMDEMRMIGVSSPEYPEMLKVLEKLHDLERKERRAPVSNDTIVTVAGSLAGILMIIVYEQKHVITSKGFSLLPRSKN